MKKFFVLFFFALSCKYVSAQEAFTVSRYHIDLKLNKDASIDITEICAFILQNKGMELSGLFNTNTQCKRFRQVSKKQKGK